jgi:hypothetical protein
MATYLLCVLQKGVVQFCTPYVVIVSTRRIRLFIFNQIYLHVSHLCHVCYFQQYKM